MSDLPRADDPGTAATIPGTQGQPVFVLRLDDGLREEQIDVRRVLRFLWGNAVLVMALAIIGLAMGFLWGKLATKIYRAEVVMSVLSDNEDSMGVSSIPAGFAGLANLAGIKVGGDSNFSAEALALLRSRMFIEQFIDDERLLPVLFAKRWSEAEQRWRVSSVPPPSLQDGYELFRRKVLRISEDRKTGLVTLQIEWRDRSLAAQWANRIVAKADQLLRERAVHQADSAMKFLNSELERTVVVELRQALFSVIERQTQKRMLANSRPEFAFRVVDPARASDEHRYVRPVKLVLIAGGLVTGGVIGLLVAILRAFFWPRKLVS